MTILLEKETEVSFDFDYEALAREVISAACDAEKCPYEAEVNLTLVDNDSIHQINREYRQIDRPTDVLSFPMQNYEAPADFSHDIPGTVALPPVPTLRDPLWQCADTNALTVCRSIRWGGWTVYPKARDVDWSAFRYVIGPKLNSSEDVR